MKNVCIQTFEIRCVMLGFAFSAVKEKPRIGKAEGSLLGAMKVIATTIWP
jgi:hypothetical protein